MENNIPTAEEFFKEKYGVNDRISTSNATLLAIEFAKLHVEACKKEQKSKLNDLVKYGAINETWEEVQKTINNTYPLTLIK
jgi:hypothetical protein